MRRPVAPSGRLLEASGNTRPREMTAAAGLPPHRIRLIGSLSHLRRSDGVRPPCWPTLSPQAARGRPTRGTTSCASR